ncbi:MAG: heat-inducible transcriptional repressor HrcA [Gammaproteobacteria bacterium]|nr:heat-inducible transcriptional repressor HrcA [Gammaproteobacteria bacterium]
MKDSASKSLEEAPPLDERSRAVLHGLIERYVREGQPVGSRILSRDLTLGLSPASIRNVMADLEDMGLISSPHVSAGRMPTRRGYRVFVDSLLKVETLKPPELKRLRRGLSRVEEGADEVAGEVSRMVAKITRMAGLVTVPRRNSASWRHIEFIRLSDRRVLAVLVLDSREVQNRVLELDKDVSPDLLAATANYLNEQFEGRTLEAVRGDLLKGMREDMRHMNSLAQTALAMGERMFDSGAGGESKADYVLAGETNLMGLADLADLNRLKALFEAFERKREILDVLDRALAAPGIQVFIGEESGYAVLGDLSVVVSSYGDEDRPLGVVGVIGPTRMAYQKVIPVVDVTARLLGSALQTRGTSPER